MAQINQKLKPFTTPNFVIAEIPPQPRGSGIKEGPKYHLRDVPEETLIEMCEDFKAEILRKHKSKPVDDG